MPAARRGGPIRYAIDALVADGDIVAADREAAAGVVQSSFGYQRPGARAHAMAHGFLFQHHAEFAADVTKFLD